jgi:transcriptional regulator with XRE-family HTH domain
MSETAIAKYLDLMKIADGDFARKIGVTAGYLSLLRNGKRSPSPAVALRISKLTGIPLEDVLFTNSADERTASTHSTK